MFVLLSLVCHLLVLLQHLASFASLGWQFLALRQKNVFVPLLHMINELSKDWVEGLSLFSLDFKVNVAMGVLSLTESHLVMELCGLKSLTVRGNHTLYEFLRHF